MALDEKNSLLSGMTAGKAFFDLSDQLAYGRPPALRHLQVAWRPHARLAVSGGPRGAESRKLALWIGGDEDVFRKFKPVIDAIGDQPYYVGPIGAGSIAKLVHNCAGYMIQTALAEVFTMGVKAGVDPLAVRQGARGRARTFDPLGDNFLQGKFDPPAFALRLAHKDVSLAVALGRENKVPMRMANMTLEEMTEALNRGWGERDSRVAMLLQEERAGVDIKVPAAAIKEVLDGDKS